MAITRWDPMNEFRTLTRRMERAFDTLGRGREPERMPGNWFSESWPVVDVYEDKDEIVVHAFVPGMEQKDVEISLDDNSLSLRGERKQYREDKRENYVHVESEYGSFSRVFPLPATVDRDRVRAELKGGVLEIHLQKREAAKPRTIPVHT